MRQCSKCQGLTIMEHLEDWTDKGVEYVPVIRCVNCGFQRYLKAQYIRTINASSIKECSL